MYNNIHPYFMCIDSELLSMSILFRAFHSSAFTVDMPTSRCSQRHQGHGWGPKKSNPQRLDFPYLQMEQNDPHNSPSWGLRTWPFFPATSEIHPMLSELLVWLESSGFGFVIPVRDAGPAWANTGPAERLCWCKHIDQFLMSAPSNKNNYMKQLEDG